MPSFSARYRKNKSSKPHRSGGVSYGSARLGAPTVHGTSTREGIGSIASPTAFNTNATAGRGARDTHIRWYPRNRSTYKPGVGSAGKSGKALASENSFALARRLRKQGKGKGIGDYNLTHTKGKPSDRLRKYRGRHGKAQVSGATSVSTGTRSSSYKPRRKKNAFGGPKDGRRSTGFSSR